MNEKPQQCMCKPNVSVFLSQPERTYWSLIPQLETVVSSYWLAALQHIFYIHGAFDHKDTSLQYQLMSLKRLNAVFLAKQLQYNYTN